MAYAILRCAKVKSLQRVAMIARHVHRLKPVANADPERLKLNRRIIGSGDIVADVRHALPEKIRKNGVIAMEFVITASPEYFRPGNPDAYGEWDAERLLDFRRHSEAFMRRVYGDNLVSMDLHLDEATPHYHCLVIPKRQDGKLDANSLFNPKTLTTLQDRWGQWMSRIGLKRGEKKSTARHAKVKEAYPLMNRLTPERLRRLLEILEEQDESMSEGDGGGVNPAPFHRPTTPHP